MGKQTLLSLTRSLAFAMAFPVAAAGTAHPARAPKAATKAPAHAINLNTASATELMQLPHIGQKTAERIVLFRKEHGAFQRAEELMNVKGVGEKSFAQLKPFLTVASAPVKK
ncbi:MAG TPA: helix-hairpin-helix domain-containing protein [Holophagaceae bacterium]|jgi:competence protein ComEA|nr:helix-hairpin-helix domain-containing protein [Holophagaceae bacterium]